MRIGIDCHDFEKKPRWGIGRHVEYILKTIAENKEFQKGNEFFLYFKSQIPEEKFLVSPIFHKRVLKFIRPSFTVYYNLLLPLLTKKDKLDTMFFPANMLPILYRGKSIVHLPIDVFYEIKYGNLALRHKFGYKILSGWAMKYADFITTNSEYSKNELIKIFPYAKNKVVSNPLGIDREKFYPDSNLVKENFILNVGQCFPRRKTKEIIEGFNLYIKKSENKQLRLIIVGKDKYRPPILDSLINNKNKEIGAKNIVRIDYVDDDELIKLYKQAKLLLYISTSEAQGLPPIEALACKTPPVVASSELTKEIFKYNAFFVNQPYGPKEIATAIQEGMTNRKRYDKILQESYSVVQRFNWKNHVSKLIELVNN